MTLVHGVGYRIDRRPFTADRALFFEINPDGNVKMWC
jgi:hypothetical protein